MSAEKICFLHIRLTNITNVKWQTGRKVYRYSFPSPGIFFLFPVALHGHFQDITPHENLGGGTPSHLQILPKPRVSNWLSPPPVFRVDQIPLDDVTT